MMPLCYHGMVPVQYLCDIGAVTIRFLCDLTETEVCSVFGKREEEPPDSGHVGHTFMTKWIQVFICLETELLDNTVNVRNMLLQNTFKHSLCNNKC